MFKKSDDDKEDKKDPSPPKWSSSSPAASSSSFQPQQPPSRRSTNRPMIGLPTDSMNGLAMLRLPLPSQGSRDEQTQPLDLRVTINPSTNTTTSAASNPDASTPDVKLCQWCKTPTNPENSGNADFCRDSCFEAYRRRHYKKRACCATCGKRGEWEVGELCSNNLQDIPDRFCASCTGRGMDNSNSSRSPRNTPPPRPPGQAAEGRQAPGIRIVCTDTPRSPFVVLSTDPSGRTSRLPRVYYPTPGENRVPSAQARSGARSSGSSSTDESNESGGGTPQSAQGDQANSGTSSRRRKSKRRKTCPSTPPEQVSVVPPSNGLRFPIVGNPMFRQRLSHPGQGNLMNQIRGNGPTSAGSYLAHRPYVLSSGLSFPSPRPMMTSSTGRINIPPGGGITLTPNRAMLGTPPGSGMPPVGIPTMRSPTAAVPILGAPIASFAPHPTGSIFTSASGPMMFPNTTTPFFTSATGMPSPGGHLPRSAHAHSGYPGRFGPPNVCIGGGPNRGHGHSLGNHGPPTAYIRDTNIPSGTGGNIMEITLPKEANAGNPMVFQLPVGFRPLSVPFHPGMQQQHQHQPCQHMPRVQGIVGQPIISHSGGEHLHPFMVNGQHMHVPVPNQIRITRVVGPQSSSDSNSPVFGASQQHSDSGRLPGMDPAHRIVPGFGFITPPPEPSASAPPDLETNRGTADIGNRGGRGRGSGRLVPVGRRTDSSCGSASSQTSDGSGHVTVEPGSGSGSSSERNSNEQVRIHYVPFPVALPIFVPVPIFLPIPESIYENAMGKMKTETENLKVASPKENDQDTAKITQTTDEVPPSPVTYILSIVEDDVLDASAPAPVTAPSTDGVAPAPLAPVAEPPSVDVVGETGHEIIEEAHNGPIAEMAPTTSSGGVPTQAAAGNEGTLKLTFKRTKKQLVVDSNKSENDGIEKQTDEEMTESASEAEPEENLEQGVKEENEETDESKNVGKQEEEHYE